jgi:hypothetical protein
MRSCLWRWSSSALNLANPVFDIGILVTIFIQPLKIDTVENRSVIHRELIIKLFPVLKAGENLTHRVGIWLSLAPFRSGRYPWVVTTYRDSPASRADSHRDLFKKIHL